MTPKIGIVTVLYNSEKVLKDFFESLSRQTYKNIVLYVIDNKSPDKSLNIAKSLAERIDTEVRIIPCDENFGVAKGNNIGIKAALDEECDYVLLSNNDIKFEKDTIKTLLDGLYANDAQLAVPKIYSYDTNTLWYAGGKFQYRTGNTIHIGRNKEDCGQFDEVKLMDYAPTCFMLIDKNVFENVGMMDEKYFVYFDDTDFIYRCKRANQKLIYYPQAVIRHKESSSTGGTTSDFSIYYFHRNILYFSLKNLGICQNIIVLTNHLIHLLIRKPFLHSFHIWKLCTKAHVDGLILFFKKEK
jgi:GT2 family glycosyltransferase